VFPFQICFSVRQQRFHITDAALCKTISIILTKKLDSSEQFSIRKRGRQEGCMRIFTEASQSLIKCRLNISPGSMSLEELSVAKEIHNTVKAGASGNINSRDSAEKIEEDFLWAQRQW
jgi:hypothetical protein